MPRKKLVVAFTITAILVSFTPTSIKLAFADNTGGKIDLFTQKESFQRKEHE